MKARISLLVLTLLVIGCQASSTNTPTVEPSYLSVNWIRPDTTKTVFQMVEPSDMVIPTIHTMTHGIEFIDEEQQSHKVVIEQDGRNQGRVIAVAIYNTVVQSDSVGGNIISTIINEKGETQKPSDFELIVGAHTLTSDKLEFIPLDPTSSPKIEFFAPLEWKCADIPTSAYKEDEPAMVVIYGKVCFPPGTK